MFIISLLINLEKNSLNGICENLLLNRARIHSNQLNTLKRYNKGNPRCCHFRLWKSNENQLNQNNPGRKNYLSIEVSDYVSIQYIFSARLL